MALDGAYRQPCPQQAAFDRCLEDPWPEFKESYPYFHEKVPGLLRPIVEETVQRLPDCGLFRHGFALTVCDSAAVYRPRHPEESVLYGVVAGQLGTTRGPISVRRGPSPLHPGCPGHSTTQAGLPAEAGPEGPPKGRPRNYSWSELMHRVFALDVLECSDCGGSLRIVAAIHPPQAIRKILNCLGLPSRPPPAALARS